MKWSLYLWILGVLCCIYGGLLGDTMPAIPLGALFFYLASKEEN